MVKGTKILKHIGYFHLKIWDLWKPRYYIIENSIFYYSMEENFNLKKSKGSAFLGISKIVEGKSKNDILVLFTGSKEWKFRGNEVEINLLRNSINEGIKQAKNINLQNLIVPDNDEEEELSFISGSDISLDNKSEYSDIKSINDKNTFSKDLQNIESDIKIANGGFEKLLKNNNGKIKKGDFNRLYLQYDKIAQRMEKINNYNKKQEYFNDQ